MCLVASINGKIGVPSVREVTCRTWGLECRISTDCVPRSGTCWEKTRFVRLWHKSLAPLCLAPLKLVNPLFCMVCAFLLSMAVICLLCRDFRLLFGGSSKCSLSSYSRLDKLPA